MLFYGICAIISCDDLKAMIGLPCTDFTVTERAGVVETACVHYRAFPQELLPELSVGFAG